MKKLEEYINDHRNQFDDGEPGRQHEENFISLLNERHSIGKGNRFSTINNWLKMAAIVIALAGLGAGIMAILGRPVSVQQNADNRLPADLIEMEQYYTVQTQEKINRIETLAGSGPEAMQVKASLNEEINSLNESSNTLKNEYLSGNRDERVVDAIRNNYRILSGLLDKVVEQLSKPEHESSVNNKNFKTRKYESTTA
ncbi:MAG: hypothetical protein AB9834_00040 [Lentimicrobium sp.]